jgi:hypothetical protein
MRFEKGRSGNPGGRPKGHGDIRELARRHTGAALATLVEICRNGGNEGARVAAATAILDRGWGKPMVYVPIPTLRAFAHIPTGAAASRGLDLDQVKSRTVRSAIAATAIGADTETGRATP